MLPLAGAGAGAAGLGRAAGAGPGTLPKAGRGRADFWALAGTAKGVSGVERPGRGTAPGVPAGVGFGRGTTPGAAVGVIEAGVEAAIPGFGATFRFALSA